MPDVQSELAAEICRELGHLRSARGNWESHWQEIAERVIPSHSTLFQSQGMSVTQGEKRTHQLVDSTAAVALSRFGAICDSLLTPRSQTWHRLTASDPVLKKDRSVRLWFEDATRALFRYRYAPKSGFTGQNKRSYKSLGAYGNGVLFLDRLDAEPGIRYRNIHLAEIYIAENHQGVVDKAYRYFPMTARQALQKWGAEKMPDAITLALTKNPEQEFFFIHCVKPREGVDPRRVDAAGMPFASYYVAEASKTLMSEGGYTRFPYTVGRYEQEPGEAYGRSPAMEVLPAIKTLNEEKKTVLKQGHRTVDPVLLAHDDGVVDAFSLKPGSINAGGVSADGRPLVHALPVGNITIGKDLMDDERMVINDAFFVTLFQILVETPQMTATEVLERTREKGILLAPTIGQQEGEYLGPMIDIEIDLLSRQGLLAPMPPLLREARGQYSIVYDSPLSRAQRAEEGAGLMRTVEHTLGIVNVTQDPAPLDHFDWDVIVPEMAEIQAVPARWMRSLDQVKAIRAGRAQQMQAQMAIQAAPGAAALMKAGTVAAKGAPAR